MMSDEIHDVVIAGAGPAGLVAAVTLARLGIRPLVVDRRADEPTLPRATTISLRTMELLRSWGLEDAVRAGGVPDIDWVGWIAPTLAEAAAGRSWPAGMPTRAQSTVLSPTSPACVPQDHLEPVLAAHARALGADVRRGISLTGVRSEPDGVTVELRDETRADGRRIRVHAQFLIGADGIRSATREALGIRSRGDDELGHRVGALFRAPLGRVLERHPYGIFSVERPDGGGTFLPAGPGDRWLYGGPHDPAAPDAAEALDPERIAARIRAGAGMPDLEVRIERVMALRFGVALAERFRHHRAFLVGDAAHRVTPRGGTGMNTAIRDGHDLGWKLGWVLNGWAGEALLDSYEAERRPVAEHNLARSADQDGSVRAADEELHVDLGGRIGHVWVAPGTSSLDLAGDGLTLVCGPGAAARWAADAGAVNDLPGRPPLQVRRLGELPARALGVAGDGALLVRPDHVPAGAWAAPDAPGLRRAVEAVAGLGGAGVVARAA